MENRERLSDPTARGDSTAYGAEDDRPRAGAGPVALRELEHDLERVDEGQTSRAGLAAGGPRPPSDGAEHLRRGGAGNWQCRLIAPQPSASV
jgi:hypothetical protein